MFSVDYSVSFEQCFGIFETIILFSVLDVQKEQTNIGITNIIVNTQNGNL